MRQEGESGGDLVLQIGEQASGRPRVEAGRFETWSLSGADGYVGGMASSFDTSEESICSQGADSSNRWTSSDH